MDLAIRALAVLVAEATSLTGEIHWDSTKPHGTRKKLLDVSRLAAFGWYARIPLAEGLASIVCKFREQFNQKRVRL